MPSRTGTSFPNHVAAALRASYFSDQDGREAPVKVAGHVPSTARCLLVTGENASGKSFFLRYLHGYLARLSQESTLLSMERRAAGKAEVSVMGSEDEESTGALSAQSVRAALARASSAKAPQVLLLDEPDLGLSPGYAQAMGVRLYEFLAQAPPPLSGMAVITHSLPLLGELMKLPQDQLAWLRFGDDLSMEEVLEGRAAHRSPQDLDELVRASRSQYRAIRRAMPRS